jgi:hypothetical protein
MAAGCIQAQRGHTDKCPSGVATQNARRARALDVGDKSVRVQRYQEATVESAMKIMAAMGVTDPSQLNPHHLRRNVTSTTTHSYAELYEWLEPGQLLAEPPQAWAADWKLASADRFAPHASPSHL